MPRPGPPASRALTRTDSDFLGSLAFPGSDGDCRRARMSVAPGVVRPPVFAHVLPGTQRDKTCRNPTPPPLTIQEPIYYSGGEIKQKNVVSSTFEPPRFVCVVLRHKRPSSFRKDLHRGRRDGKRRPLCGWVYGLRDWTPSRFAYRLCAKPRGVVGTSIFADRRLGIIGHTAEI